MQGRRLRGSRLFLLVGVAATLLALASSPTLAQEADMPEAEDLTESLEGRADDLADQAGLDLGHLTAGELSRLCRTRPDLVPPEECRNLSAQASGGNSGGGGTSAREMSSPTRTSTGSDHVSAPRRGTARGQSTARRPRIAVRKTNDADGNGRLSPSEVSSRSGADVPFRVTIRNVGRRAVTIRRITDSYDANTMDVCVELVGDQLRPGQRARCSFVLGDYAPPEFDSRANTIEVTATAGQGGGRVTESAISTVTTIPGSGDEVLGSGERNPAGEDRSEEFAITGAYLDRMLGLGAALILAGALLIRAGATPPPNPRGIRVAKISGKEEGGPLPGPPSG